MNRFLALIFLSAALISGTHLAGIGTLVFAQTPAVAPPAPQCPQTSLLQLQLRLPPLTALQTQFQQQATEEAEMRHQQATQSYSQVAGQMGVNALRAIPAADPAYSEDVRLRLGIGTQWSHQGDRSHTLDFGLQVPLGSGCTFEMSGWPLEYYDLSERTQSEWQTSNGSGTNFGDIWLGGRKQLMMETESAPALGARILLKTATGSEDENRRAVDGAGYAFMLSAAKDFYRAEPSVLETHSGWDVTRARWVVEAGFYAYDQVRDGKLGQNDAPTLAAEVGVDFANLVRLRAGLQSYFGWENQDKPIEVFFECSKRFSTHSSGYICVTEGLFNDDAPRNTVNLGIVTNF